MCDIEIELRRRPLLLLPPVVTAHGGEEEPGSRLPARLALLPVVLLLPL